MRGRFFSFALALSFVSPLAFADSPIGEAINIEGTCNYFGGDDGPDNIRVRTYEPDKRALALINNIVDVYGLKQNFIVKAAGVANALATVKGSQRYILYSQSFVSNLRNKAGSDWAAAAVLAHEIGHHLNGHTLDKGGSRPELELQADWSAGSVLHKMGASLEDATRALKLLGNDKATSTHPAKTERIAAITNGWHKSQDTIGVLPPRELKLPKLKAAPPPPPISLAATSSASRSFETRLPFESEMVKISGGCFNMGSPTSEKERQSDERQHNVCVKDFYIGKYEVTNAEYATFLNDVKKRGTKDKPWFDTKAEDSDSHIEGSVGNFSVEQGYENHPVIEVSWFGATAYAEWLKEKTGKDYRLPTEAQWEYAARAGTTTPFYAGNCISTSQANYDGNYDYNNCGAKTGIYKSKTVAIGSYLANSWGLHDMAGNVWEWTCSEYVKDYDGSEQHCLSKNNASLSALRGGSWDDVPSGVRSAARGRGYAVYRNDGVGFRLVRM